MSSTRGQHGEDPLKVDLVGPHQAVGQQVEAQIGVSNPNRRAVQVVDRDTLRPDGDASDRIQLLQFGQRGVDGLPDRRNAELDLWKVHVELVLAAHGGEAVGPCWSHQPGGYRPRRCPISPEVTCPRPRTERRLRETSRKTTTLLPWWYTYDMPRGKPSPKLAITVDPDVAEQVVAAAAQDDMSVSAWMTAAARRALLVRDGLLAVAEWEQEQGPLTEAELEAARKRVADELRPSAGRRSA
jgi:hypothetical protein